MTKLQINKQTIEIKLMPHKIFNDCFRLFIENGLEHNRQGGTFIDKKGNKVGSWCVTISWVERYYPVNFTTRLD